MTGKHVNSSRPRICVTLGDPAGIGPEITARALCDSEVSQRANWLLVGSEKALSRALKGFGGELAYTVHSKLLPKGLPAGNIELLDIAAGRVPNLGSETASGGKWAGGAVSAAVDLLLKKQCAALVTAPLNKNNLMAAGYDYPGHTEMLATLCGIRTPVMLLCSGDLRVALFTRHMALRTVFSHLKTKGLVDMACALARELKRFFGIAKPRIAVLGLNPHSGEEGLFGTEEKSVITPAIKRLRRRGVNADGPVPADTAFSPRTLGQFDCILAMYHDQGLAPFKALAFGKGVNVTLNLPFARTSPDHGTAFDIAAEFRANSSSMVEAMKLAVELTGRDS
ncbi:MAG: 4-hydroxythreonine-4-phosphate dehydrogenase PdxA [Planctomycetota bacterium]|nr:4-hydroxythreonine-4-phosphate dehydrogenase PdxA [Planctomycetota bacterium]